MKFPFIVKTLRYSVAIFIGMPLNIYVLTRMFKLARKCSDVYRFTQNSFTIITKSILSGSEFFFS